MFQVPVTTPGDHFEPEHGLGHSSTLLARGPGEYPLLQGVPLTDKEPGFFYFSTVISPVEEDVIVWDTGLRVVQARRLSDLSLRWEVKLLNADCAMVAADRGHVYVPPPPPTPPHFSFFVAFSLSPSTLICAHHGFLLALARAVHKDTSHGTPRLVCYAPIPLRELMIIQ